YVLISAITALMDGNAWTIDEVQDIIQMLFDQQYTLTETVTTETRYRTETRTDTDPETGETTEYEVEVPYTYYICTVTLENFNLSHVPVYVMSEEQLERYSLYMSTLGNRPDLFAGSSYVSLYYNTDYTTYTIPSEALSDEAFANMIAEAEKYLGYPYVWGGSSPSTSFDCSGFVSWVINNCGNGWSVGRQTANGLLNLCTVVSASDAQPGDLIFFQGTYNTSGASHVGIYVGNGMMIHCGDPIQYTSINTSYWQSHFLAYGRLPGM
ncbi:MAG: C40 family peptidase, partial [Lachnospiraceae bacterium]|nr:C40 family peptidase [Lachnospiraceae bacterium]